MAKPQEEFDGDLKRQLIEAYEAYKASGKRSEKKMEKLWTMYDDRATAAKLKSIGFRTLQRWLSPTDQTIPRLREYDILAGVLNEIQDKVSLPRLMLGGGGGKPRALHVQGTFPAQAPDLPISRASSRNHNRKCRIEDIPIVGQTAA